jgi:hypothetical protein
MLLKNDKTYYFKEEEQVMKEKAHIVLMGESVLI